MRTCAGCVLQLVVGTLVFAVLLFILPVFWVVHTYFTSVAFCLEACNVGMAVVRLHHLVCLFAMVVPCGVKPLLNSMGVLACSFAV